MGKIRLDYLDLREDKFKERIAQLEAELKQARERADVFEHADGVKGKQIWALAEAHRKAAAENATLSADFYELRKDRDRLDKLEAWLQNNQYHYDLMLQSDYEDGVWFAQFQRLDQGVNGMPLDPTDSKTLTVREAIDAMQDRDEVLRQWNQSAMKDSGQ